MTPEKSPFPSEAPIDTLEVMVQWGHERSLDQVRPAAVEIAGLLMGLEETYEVLAGALGYPPHFLKVTSIHNPELKLGLEGGKEVIDALRELLYAVPELIANLFRPKAAWKRSQLEGSVRSTELEARGAAAEAGKRVAEADAAEAVARKIRADAEIAELNMLRSEVRAIPIRADAAAHAVLRDIVESVATSDPLCRVPFIADTARYAIAANSYDARSQIILIPIPPSPKGRNQSKGMYSPGHKKL
jgi:hypothetical protein